MAGEDEGQFDRVAQLRADQQQQRIEDDRAEEEAARLEMSGEESKGSVFGIARDEFNDDVVRTTVKPEPVMFGLIGFPFLSAQLYKGKMLSGGKDKFFDEPSFRAWGLPFLPKEGMDGLIVAGWVIIGFLLIPSLIFDLFLIYLIGKAMTDPFGAAMDAKNMLGAFGCDLVKWFGFPSILC